MKSDFLRILHERGFIHQGTDIETLDTYLAENKGAGYIGFDATASSLHVGNLTMIMLLYWFQKTGHRPIVLMGGGTTKVGDPSGRDESRQLLTDAQIDENIASIQRVFSKFLNFGTGPQDALMVNNNDWLTALNYIDFLRDYGRHFSVNRMLSFDSVKLRLEREQPLSFLEFNYMILQAYDFLELYKIHGCILQMGGSDQWGNIVNGVELTRRVLGKEVFGITTPLVTTSSGAKMGKTAAGAVWLNSDRVPPYDYWQFWRNTDDADVIRYLKLFTIVSMEEIARLEKLEGSEINDAKKILADEATSLVHGHECLNEIHATISQLFEDGPGSLDSLPSIDLPQTQLREGILVLDLLVQLALASSKGEARRLIQGNGVRLNDEPVQDELQKVTTDHLILDGKAKLSVGKKRHAVVKGI